jgi:hypothetical protein
VKKIDDIVDFRRDLFFDGAVQIEWFASDAERRDMAAAHFVFHGPQYHGVSEDDVQGTSGFQLTDTVQFLSNNHVL